MKLADKKQVKERLFSVFHLQKRKIEDTHCKKKFRFTYVILY